MIRLAALAGLSSLAIAASPALAQSMQNMPGMNMPMPAKKPPAAKPKPSATKRPAPKPKPRPARASPKPAPSAAMPDMDMSQPAKTGTTPAMPSMPGMDMAGSDKKAPGAMPGMTMPSGAMPDMAPTGTALPAGNAPPPPPPADHYSDRFFPAADMAKARGAMMREDGGRPFGTVLFNLAEYQARAGRDGYRWDGEGWFGGDINRLTIKSEGEGAFGKGVDSAEVQALYSRAIGPYFNFQAGIRHDFQPTPTRTYATVGFEGLAPYMFEVEGALFVSPQGDVLGRLEGYYDQRITQRLILQPRVELNLSAQDMPAQRVGAGLSNAELGLRLRYEITRRFAPYIGVSYEAKTGRTADYARADGQRPRSTSFVAGVRFGF